MSSKDLNLNIPNLTAILETYIFLPVACICVVLLHYFIGNSTHLQNINISQIVMHDANEYLTTECTNKVICKRQKMNVLNDPSQRTIRISAKFRKIKCVKYTSCLNNNLELTAALLATSWSPKNSISGYFLRHSARTRGSSEAT